jgi:hypothetical protein
MIQFKSILAIAAFACTVGASPHSYAAGCAVTASFTAPSPEIEYDPFQPAAQRSNPFSLALTAPVGLAGQARVRSIDYQFLDTDSPLQPRIGANGAVVEIVRSGHSILFARATADYSDAANFNTVTIPNGTNVGTGVVGLMLADGRQDLAAGRASERFDMAYRCNFSDGSTGEGLVPAALLASVSTQYLLRATVVGGGTSKTLYIDPVSRVASGGMAIRSTGPFSLAIASTNGLNLFPLGTSTGTSLPDNQKIPYEVRIDGDAMAVSSAPKMCARSGLGGSVLTVTVTPEINGAASASNCGV